MRAGLLLMAAGTVCALVPALAQDVPPSAVSWPSAIRATAAYPVQQDASQFLGSNLVGATVRSGTNASIGTISNLLINENGAVESAVIAIPGIFGLTKKSVAVTYKSLNIVRNIAGDSIDHVTIASTRGDLLRVAEFKPLSKQKVEQRQAALAQ
jgi:hypothetical protein